MTYFYENGDIEEPDMFNYDTLVEEKALEFNSESKEINAYLFSAGQL